MDTLLNDLRFGFRLIGRDKAFAATVVLTLTLAVAGNAAIFTIVRSVLLRPLPYPDGDRLALVYDAFPGAGVERAGSSVPNYFDRLELTDVFDSQALYRSRGLDVGESGRAERVTATEVTPSFFRVLRAEPIRGRVFTEDEGQAGREKVVVVSHGY